MRLGRETHAHRPVWSTAGDAGVRRWRRGALTGGMETWNALVRRIADNGGVGTPTDARACGVSEATWHRRTRAEGWGRPCTGVRVAPWATASRLTDLRVGLAACGGRAAAAGRTALWCHGVGDAPSVVDLVLPGASSYPRLPTRVRARRASWLVDTDVQTRDGLAVLTPEAALVTCTGMTERELRAVTIDAIQAGLTTATLVAERLATVGPVAGRSRLGDVLVSLGASQPESIFHASVLDDLLARGYPAATSPLEVPTPDGRGVLLDIPLPDFEVAVEPEGDRFHASRQARRDDRRRAAQLAGTSWVVVPVDWRDWHDRPAWVRASLDAALQRQLAAGRGSRAALPPHLR